MKKQSLIRAAALLICLLFLSGCVRTATSDADSRTLNIYRLADSGTGSDLLQAEACVLRASERANVETALSLFSSASQNRTLLCALPEGVEILSWTVTEGIVTVELSDAFALLEGMEQTVPAFALVLTLCELENVDAVTILSDGETLFRKLSADDALSGDEDTDPHTRRLRLYFADESDTWLVSEYHTVTMADTEAPERYVVEELLRGPNDSTLRSVIPTGTTLRSCTVDNGVCTVDLSSEFTQTIPDSAGEQRLLLWSLVNSLTALTDVEQVQILCDGQGPGIWGYYDLDQPRESCPEAVGPPSAGDGETSIELVRSAADGQTLISLPCVIQPADWNSLAEAAVYTLTDSSAAGLPALFSGSGSVLSVQLTGRICTVDLAQSFFASLTAEERMTAAKCLAATLCKLDTVRSVRLTLAGEPAVYDGTDYSGPWTIANIH